jgi:hypothetical protein
LVDLRRLRQCWVKARVVAPPQPSGNRFTFAVLRAGMNKIRINSRRLDQDCNRPPVKGANANQTDEHDQG